MKRKLHFSNGGVTSNVQLIEGIDTLILVQNFVNNRPLIPPNSPQKNEASSNLTFDRKNTLARLGVMYSVVSLRSPTVMSHFLINTHTVKS